MAAPDPKSSARTELISVLGLAAASIVSEVPSSEPFIFHGYGPQIRVYCVFGDDAISGDGINEGSLPEVPTQGDWCMSLPCLPEDLDWTQKKLKGLSPRITARAVGQGIDEAKSNSSHSQNGLVLNLREFQKS
jgi:hypothetical protein